MRRGRQVVGLAVVLLAVAGAAAVMAILGTAKIVYLPAYGGQELLAAVGRVRFTSIAAMVEAFANLGLSIFFVLVVGWGIALE